MKLLVTGSRDWPLAEKLVVFSYMDMITRGSENVTLLHGACSIGTDVPNSPYKGVDGLSDAYGKLRGWDVQPFPADRSKGRSGFAIRNLQMVAEMPDRVLAFFLQGAGNRGTQMTHDMALSKNLYVVRIKI